MWNFIKRNMPVFVVGGITVVAFLIIIAISEQGDRGSLLPGLIRVDPEEGNILRPGDSATGDSDTEINPTIDASVHNTGKSGDPLEGLVEYSGSDSLSNQDEIDKAMLQKRETFLDRIRLDEQQVAATHGTLEITYSEDGFVPRNASGYMYQKVIWTNTTDKAIYIQPNIPKYDDWKEEAREVSPGATLEYVIPKTGGWSYRDRETKDYGAIHATEAFRL